MCEEPVGISAHNCQHLVRKLRQFAHKVRMPRLAGIRAVGAPCSPSLRSCTSERTLPILEGSAFSMNPRFHHGQRRRRLSTPAMLVFIVLLLLPALASLRLARSFDPRVIFGYLIAI